VGSIVRKILLATSKRKGTDSLAMFVGKKFEIRDEVREGLDTVFLSPHFK
jgi:hypothetical protein